MAKFEEFHIVALGAQGVGVSGGDRIFIELGRRLSNKTQVHLWLSNEGSDMCRRMKLKDGPVHFHIHDLSKRRRYGSVVYNLMLVATGIKIGFGPLPPAGSYIYSASEFWMDSIPTLIWKLRNQKFVWIASWYQTAPSPVRGFSLSSNGRHRIASVPYWLFQKTTKPYISRFADIINVNNASEKLQFPFHAKRGKVFVMYGAVDTEAATTAEKKFSKTPIKYDAVFQGRFHPQKGVNELIDIWNMVVKKIPSAKLAMIGDGPLMATVKDRISSYSLQKNIKLLGYVFDGDFKYKTFLSSKVVVHPAYYDSGGMASAEAMVFGKPAVGFDLPSYKDYYPKGMIKVPQENKKQFARAVITLLQNKQLYRKTAAEAKKMVYSTWSWNTRATEFWKFITSK